MFGEIGRETAKWMAVENSKQVKSTFRCFFRRVSANSAKKINDKFESYRQGEIKKSGESKFNNLAAFRKLQVRENDLEGKFVYYSQANELSGVRIFARRVDYVQEAIKWKPTALDEIKYAISVVHSHIASLQTAIPRPIPSILPKNLMPSIQPNIPQPSTFPPIQPVPLINTQINNHKDNHCVPLKSTSAPHPSIILPPSVS